LAGDTFEDNGIERSLIQKTADLLSKFEIPAYIISGNHDPLVPGSVWEHPVWNTSKNLNILKEEVPIEIPGGFLFPCPIYEKRSGKDPTSWINTNDTSGIKVGIAHGTVDNIHQDEPEYPIPRDIAQRKGLDYLALGHWHSSMLYDDNDGIIRMAYSGTHETTKFGERDSGNILIVDIPSAGVAPNIVSVKTGGLIWNTLEENIIEQGDLVEIQSKIENIEHPDLTLLELNISGLLSAEDCDKITRIEEILSSRFLFSRMDTSHMYPHPEDENWLLSLPVGVIQNAATKLRNIADPQFIGQRPEGVSAELASRALLELYSLSKEVLP